MTLPASRSKLLPVRGQIATLNSDVSGLLDGELAISEDERWLYYKHGGIFT